MGKLYVVSTPIGNLKDITYRAVETLNNVDIIACEDTRISRKLLSYYKINSKRLISYHDRNAVKSAKGIVQLLNNGNDIALISDAGSPLISDPGYILIRECYKANIKVLVIPGVSAHLMAVQYSSLDTHYKFLGFLSPKTIARQNQLKKLTKGTYVVHVSPYKLIKTLNDIELTLGSNTLVSLSKELTKLYETIYNGTITEGY